jgi:hypothetical protein
MHGADHNMVMKEGEEKNAVTLAAINNSMNNNRFDDNFEIFSVYKATTLLIFTFSFSFFSSLASLFSL